VPSPLQQLLDEFPFPASLGDASHCFVYVNPAFSEVYGWTRQEIVGLPGAILLPRNFSSTLLKRIQNRIAHSHAGWSEVISQAHKNGGQLHMHCRAFPVKPSLAQNPVLHLGIFAPPGKLAEVETALVALLTGAVLNHAAMNGSARAFRVRRTRGEEICRLAALGYSRKEISAMMSISVSTVGVVLFRAKQRDRAQ
jgi:PAS domain S-box-containing protein